MIAYSYDKVTKQYIGTRECQLDPLESKNAGHNIWLLPANSTFTTPPINKEGFNIIWNGIDWEYEEIYVEPEPEPVVEPEPIIEPDPEPEPEPELTLEEVKEAKIVELKHIRDTKELEPIEYAGHYFDFDLKSYNRITAAADVLDRADAVYQQNINSLPVQEEEPQPDTSKLTPEELAYLEEINNTPVEPELEPESESTVESDPEPTVESEQNPIDDYPRPNIMWTTADNDNVELTADGLHGIIQAAAVRSNALHIQYRILKTAVENADSIPSVQAIEWDNYEDYN